MALQIGDTARAEKLGRWAVAYDPGNREAHRNLGLALAMQGKVGEALCHLVRGTREQAPQVLAGVLHEGERVVEAMAVLDYASRWYARAEPWHALAELARSMGQTARALRAYQHAYQLDAKSFGPAQLDAYAGVLDEVGDHLKLESIAAHLLFVANDNPAWLAAAWNHHACALIGLGKFSEAEALAERARRRRGVVASSMCCAIPCSACSRPASWPRQRCASPIQRRHGGCAVRRFMQ